MEQPIQPDFSRLENAVRGLNSQCTDEEWNYLRTGARLESVAAHDFFVQAGQKDHRLGFVNEGLLRIYYVNEKGEDITIQFSAQGDYATDYYSFITQSPSKYSFQCLEPTTLLTFSYQHIQQGYQQYPGLERYGRLVTEEVFKVQQRRIESFQFDGAEKRYLDFIQQNPALFNRISLTHLSSYIGIERQSLSRIRKKIMGL
ncbi:Crp/Fnr family transcriptional regulator [Spirosoma arcticum]